MALRKDELGHLLAIEAKMDQAAALEATMATADFWADQERARTVSQKYAALKSLIDRYFAAETPEELTALEVETLFTGPHDEASAVMSIHAGAGGTEAQDWAAMLARMYERAAERHGWRISTLDESLGEEAGLKSVTFRITGDHVFGWLKSEAGVHRLVRMSPFDADHARHTSFALVELVPELTETPQVQLEDKDLKIDVYRSGGKGGQNVNKVETAVRVTHLPTGLVAASQNERSQAQNKEIALTVLRSKLAIKMEAERAAELKELRGEYHSAEWGNQIRSYVLHPYQLVKDHRTEIEAGNTEGVLDGAIDQFLEGYLRWFATQNSHEKSQVSDTIPNPKSN